VVARHAIAAAVAGGAAVLVAVVIVIAVRRNRAPVPAPPPPLVSSLAVIPLYDRSDSAAAWLAEGVAFEIGRALRNLPGVRVASARSTTTHDASWRSLRRLQDRLNVGAVLYVEAGRNERGPVIIVQLKGAADDSTLLERTFPALDASLLAVEDTIAGEVANAFRTLGHSSNARAVGAAHTRNTQAHAFFLRAVHHQTVRESAAHRRAVALLERAVALDSQYAAAWSGLASSYATLSDSVNPAETRALRRTAEIAARRAIRLDSLFAEPHAVIAALHVSRGDTTEGKREYATAIRLDPQLASARYEYGLLLAETGRLSEAVREIRRAHELEPLAADYHETYIALLERAGRVKEAREQRLEMRRLAR
jgi:Tfp pilus assembly protein PilF/TolB-like protein